jgi:S-adenosylmethionine:tRNA ribosyltransferase-isomerase
MGVAGDQRGMLTERSRVLRTADLDYDLPPERIATHPVHPRDAARLMVVAKGEAGAVGEPGHRRVRDLPGLLRPGDLLVFNTTRVLPARMRGVRVGTGGRAEVLYLHEGLAAGALAWTVLIKGRHTRAGAEFDLFDRQGNPSGVRLRVTGRPQSEPEAWTVEVEQRDKGNTGGTTVRRGEGQTLEVLNRVGLTPLPPYILRARRDAGDPGNDDADRADYQTVYARESGDPGGDSGGSVAAPTAGLHFTPELLAALARAGVGRAEVILHVGTGTFRPVETEFVEEHPMHEEWCGMTPEAVEAVRAARARGGRVIAVGTTAARTLESYAAAIGEGSGPIPGSLRTRLLVTPGYRWRWVDGLLTNFHLPRSTLMALVGAMVPGGVAGLKGLYAEAVRRGYRFYSFGDAMLIA